jgi:4-amino-4-deoxy-L-arabinose transferase-like glycosyltransferase
LSSQLAAAVPLVAAILPIYCITRRLYGRRPAALGSLLFIALPEVARLGADGISDSLHLLFFCTALWAMVEYWTRTGSRVQGSGFRGQRRLPPQTSLTPGDGNPRDLYGVVLTSTAGLCTGMALLTRAESLVLAATFVLALVVLQVVARYRQPWSRVLASIGLFLAGIMLAVTPYLLAVEASSPQAITDRLLGRYDADVLPSAPASSHAWWRAGGERMTFPVKEPGTSRSAAMPSRNSVENSLICSVLWPVHSRSSAYGGCGGG